ncbi:SYUB protein, partial [Polypterus senegalus]
MEENPSRDPSALPPHQEVTSEGAPGAHPGENKRAHIPTVWELESGVGAGQGSHGETEERWSKGQNERGLVSRNILKALIQTGAVAQAHAACSSDDDVILHSLPSQIKRTNSLYEQERRQKVSARPVAEKTKEQASQLGGAVFSGAGNIAAATGLMKKEEFPTDIKSQCQHAIDSRLFSRKIRLLRSLVGEQVIKDPIEDDPSKDLTWQQEQYYPPVFAIIQGITLPFPDRDNKSCLPVSPVMTPISQIEAKIVFNAKRIALPPAWRFTPDTTDPCSLSYFQLIHHLCNLSQTEGLTANWRISLKIRGLRDVQHPSWKISFK